MSSSGSVRGRWRSNSLLITTQPCLHLNSTFQFTMGASPCIHWLHQRYLSSHFRILCCHWYMYITAHKALVKVGILHHDISLTNLTLACISSHNNGEGCPPNSLQGDFLIDFNYATWLKATSCMIAKTDKTVYNKYILYHCMCWYLPLCIRVHSHSLESKSFALAVTRHLIMFISMT